MTISTAINYELIKPFSFSFHFEIPVIHFFPKEKSAAICEILFTYNYNIYHFERDDLLPSVFL